MNSFTIKCDKCGNISSFKNGSATNNGHIHMAINYENSWQEDVEDISMYCENINCDNYVDLAY